MTHAAAAVADLLCCCCSLRHSLSADAGLILHMMPALSDARYFRIITTDHFLSVKVHANEIFSLLVLG